MSIKILGAGISGLTAAINLSKAGYEVDIYDSNRDSGSRFCGDLQGLENWSDKKDVLSELRDMSIAGGFDCEPFFEFTITNTSRTIRVSTKRPLFYLVKRGTLPGSLDQALKKQALEEGVNIHYGKPPPGKPDIVATGPHHKRIVGIVKGMAFKTKSRDMAVGLLGDRFAYRGYSYLLITKGYGCMCSVIIGDSGRTEGCFQETTDFFDSEYDIDIREPRKVTGVGNFSILNRYQNGESLYVGEAAHLQDFLWGFGMRYAFRSGYLAARSIIEGIDYERAARKAFSKSLRAGLVNRYLWERMSQRDYNPVVKSTIFTKLFLFNMNRYNMIHKAFLSKAMRRLRERYPMIF